MIICWLIESAKVDSITPRASEVPRVFISLCSGIKWWSTFFTIVIFEVVSDDERWTFSSSSCIGGDDPWHAQATEEPIILGAASYPNPKPKIAYRRTYGTKRGRRHFILSSGALTTISWRPHLINQEGWDGAAHRYDQWSLNAHLPFPVIVLF